MNTQSIDEQLLIILSNYSNDLAALKKRNGMLPADGAVAQLKQLLIRERIALIKKLGDDGLLGPWDTDRIVHKLEQELQSQLTNQEGDSNE